MKNVLIRDMSPKQSELIKKVMKHTEQTAATKAIFTALEDYLEVCEELDKLRKERNRLIAEAGERGMILHRFKRSIKEIMDFDNTL